MKTNLSAGFVPFLVLCLAQGPYAFAQAPTTPPPLPAEQTPPGQAPAGQGGAPAPGVQAPAPAPSAPIVAPPAPAAPAPAPGAAPAPAPGAATAPAPGTPAPAPAPLPNVSPPVVLPPSPPPPAGNSGTELFGTSGTIRRRPGEVLKPVRKNSKQLEKNGRAAVPPRAMEATPPAGAPAPGASPTVTLSQGSEGTVEIPGEKEFNQCKKYPSGKRIVKFNFKPDSEIADLIGWISTISCTQFLISSQTPIAGKKVTILSPQLITPEEAYRLFLGALDAVNLTVEPMGKFLRVIESGRARFANTPFIKDGAGQTGGDKRYITRLFRFDHLDSAEVLNNLYNQVRGEQGVGIAYQGSLIVTDQAAMIDRFADIVRELDVPQGNKDQIWMVRVKNSSAAEMANRLAEIFTVQQLGTGGRRVGGAPGAPPPPPPAAPQQQKPNLRKDLIGQLTITKLIPDERSNQLIVVASEQAHDWLLTILKKLDVPIEGGGDGRFHIYYCEFANCDELAATLSAITGVAVQGGIGVRRASRGATPGAPAAPAPPVTPTGPGQQQALPQLFEGDVRVTFDGATNSLVVYSSLKDYQALRRVIDKLDAPRKQVYVEAMIMEVLLDKTRDVGVAYHGGIPFTGKSDNDSVVIGGFDAGKTLNPSALAADLVGLAGAVFGPALEATTSRLFGTQVDIPSFGAFVKLLQRNNDVNVLSTPHLLITNNQEGEISVGQRLPFPGTLLGGGLGQQAAGLGFVPQVSVQREDVSLKMKLLPSVNEHNLIRIDVDVEISDLLSSNFGGLGPATTKRTAKTPVICKDQQTVVIGGLISDRTSDTVQKVPILGDIPLLGFFFRNTTKQMLKSNIIIALTPYVITDNDDLRRVAEKKMRERREFIERYSNAEDKASFEGNIDYRRKRGMLEEINRAAKEIDDEDAALRRLRERDLLEESVPIELPTAAPAPHANEQRPGAPAAQTPSPSAPQSLAPASRPAALPSPAPSAPRSIPVSPPVAAATTASIRTSDARQTPR
jgi:general secretion pathway protein D